MDSVTAAGATVFQLLSDECCDGALVDGGAPFEDFEEAMEGQSAKKQLRDSRQGHGLRTHSESEQQIFPHI